jgi:hypothetical protein
MNGIITAKGKLRTRNATKPPVNSRASGTRHATPISDTPKAARRAHSRRSASAARACALSVASRLAQPHQRSWIPTRDFLNRISLSFTVGGGTPLIGSGETA